MKNIFKKEFVIGLSVIVAIGILIFGIEYLKGVNLFKPANFYYAYYDNVAGLEVSAPVTIDGYKVGQVREINFDYEKPGKIQVLLALNKNLHLSENSVATIGSTLMSGSYIEIKRGDSKKMLEVGSELQTQTGSDLMASISNDIMPSVNSILPRIDSLIYNLNVLVSDPALLASIRRLDGITGDVKGITGDVKGITGGLSKSLNTQVPYILGRAGRVTNNLDSISLNLMQLSNDLKSLPLKGTMDNVNRITENLTAFSNQLNDKNSTLGLLTSDPELYNRINRVAADVDSLIVDIKKNPKRYISIKLL